MSKRVELHYNPAGGRWAHVHTMGDIGEEETETRELEPFPETAPVPEPSPQVVPSEPVPA